MAEITRNVPDVRPNNYIRPGVQKPSPLSLVAALGGQAMELDAQLATERLTKDADALRTEYEVSAPGAVAVQEANEPLSSADQKQVDSLKGNLQSNSTAVDQGIMSYDQYRIRGERLLRMAISKRPGLAQEFRAAAAMHLGVDVVGASVDVLASWERQALQAMASSEEKNGPDYKRARDQLDMVGVVNAHMTDEQALTAHMQNEDAIRAMLVQQAENEVVTTQAGTLEGQQKLRRPAATASFVAEVQKAKLDTYRSFSQGFAAIKSGQVTPAQMGVVINNGQMELSGRISTLRAAIANGDVTADLAEKEIAGLEELGRQMEDLASGKLDASLMETKINSMILYMQHGMMSQEAVTELAAATKVFGPELMSMYVGPGGSFAKTGAIAVGNTLLNTGSPVSRASNAGSTAASVISTTLDRGGSKSEPEMVRAMAQTLVNAGTSFVELSPKEFKADYLTGANGYITKLHAHRGALAKALGDGEKQELMGSVSIAGLSNYHALAIAFGSKYPAMAKKVTYDIDISTGDFLHPKPGVTLTGAEQSAIRQYNQAFAGKKILQLYQDVLGVDAMTARNLFLSGNQRYNELKKEQATKKAPGASGSGSWWESL